MFYFILFISSHSVSSVSLSFFSLSLSNDKMIWHYTKCKLCAIALNCFSSFHLPGAFITANYHNRFLLFIIICSCRNDHKFKKFWLSGYHSCLAGFFCCCFLLTEHLDAHYHQYICRLLLFISNRVLLGMQTDFRNTVILRPNDKPMLCLILENQINYLWLNLQQISLC